MLENIIPVPLPASSAKSSSERALALLVNGVAVELVSAEEEVALYLRAQGDRPHQLRVFALSIPAAKLLSRELDEAVRSYLGDPPSV